MKELEKININYNFNKWNTTSLSFLNIMLNDKTIKEYHYIIKNIYDIININKNNILNLINNNSIDKSAFKIFNSIEKKINKYLLF